MITLNTFYLLYQPSALCLQTQLVLLFGKKQHTLQMKYITILQTFLASKWKNSILLCRILGGNRGNLVSKYYRIIYWRGKRKQLSCSCRSNNSRASWLSSLMQLFSFIKHFLKTFSIIFLKSKLFRKLILMNNLILLLHVQLNNKNTVLIIMFYSF